MMCSTSNTNCILHIFIHQALINCTSKKMIVIRDLPPRSNLNAYQKSEIKMPVYIFLTPSISRFRQGNFLKFL